MKTVNIGIIGCNFMGKAHSNAYLQAPRFFDVPITPVLKVACAAHKDRAQAFARRWGWQETDTDWRRVVERKDIDVIDIAVPTFLHRDIALAAVKAGKHIFCEKPLALNYGQARQMWEAVKDAGIVHYLNHNYRRCPAVLLAKQLIDEGKIGRLFHWRGAYLQSWIIDPDFPLTWHLKKETAGAGPHNDLNSHSVDLARFLMGDIASVIAMTKTFIPERPLDTHGSGAFSAAKTSAARGAVTVDDAAFMVTEFENGAMGSFDASRFATGRKNYNSFEIYGDKGGIIFNLERMNELQYFAQDDPAYAQGFRTILVTEPVHAYMPGWWPPGHIIGYEHEFVHSVVDFLRAVDTRTTITPNFYDGMKTMQVLSAALHSAKTGRKINLNEYTAEQES